MSSCLFCFICYLFYIAIFGQVNQNRPILVFNKLCLPGQMGPILYEYLVEYRELVSELSLFLLKLRQS